MSFRLRTRTLFSTSVPAERAQAVVSGEELAALVGIRPSRLARLVGLGLVEPVSPGADEFTVASAIRLARMLRLHGDLGVHLADAEIILDLIDQLHRLEAELERLRGSLS